MNNENKGHKQDHKGQMDSEDHRNRDKHTQHGQGSTQQTQHTGAGSSTGSKTADGDQNRNPQR
jgi:hypothetical protein